MKRISSLLIGAGFALIASTGFSADDTKTTDLNSNWTCSTNASSSSSSSDKAADNNMENKAQSANDAFAYASKNCRDCTKITCETSNNS